MTSTSKHVTVRSLLLGTFSFIAAFGCSDTGRSVAPTTKFRDEPQALFTTATNPPASVIARGTFPDPINLNRETNSWHFNMKIQPSTDVAVLRVSFPAGTNGGWHTQPGPVFVRVMTGTLTFYKGDDPSCTPIVRTAGQTYVHSGNVTQIARNETGADAEIIGILFAPVGVPLRIDQPNPGNCPF